MHIHNKKRETFDNSATIQATVFEQPKVARDLQQELGILGHLQGARGSSESFFMHFSLFWMVKKIQNKCEYTDSHSRKVKICSGSEPLPCVVINCSPDRLSSTIYPKRTNKVNTKNTPQQHDVNTLPRQHTHLRPQQSQQWRQLWTSQPALHESQNVVDWTETWDACSNLSLTVFACASLSVFYECAQMFWFSRFIQSEKMSHSFKTINNAKVTSMVTPQYVRKI